MEGLMYDCLFWDDAVQCHGEGCCQIAYKQGTLMWSKKKLLVRRKIT